MMIIKARSMAVSGTGKRQKGTSLKAENVLSVYVCTNLKTHT